MPRRILLIRPTLPPDDAVGAPITPTEFALILLRRFVMRCATLHRPDAVVVFATPEALDRIAPPRAGLPPNRPVGLTWRAHLDGLKCPWTLVPPGGSPDGLPGGALNGLPGGWPDGSPLPEPPPLGDPPFAYLEIEVADDDCGVIRWIARPEVEASDDDCGVIRRIARADSPTDRDMQAAAAGHGEVSGATLRSAHDAPPAHNPADYATFPTSPRRHTLRLPDGVALVDRHIHTHFAYCSCDMDPARVAPLARAFGLADFSLSEHSDQLYFTSEALANREMMRRGLDLVLEARANEEARATSEALGDAAPRANSPQSDAGRLPGVAELHSAMSSAVPSATQHTREDVVPSATRRSQEPHSIVAARMDAWVRAVREAGLSDDRLGFETECDLQGRPILLPEDAARAPRRIGAIHNLAATLDLPRVATPRVTGDRDNKDNQDNQVNKDNKVNKDAKDAKDNKVAQDFAAAAQRAGEEFLRLLEPFAASGITTLAHPFRVFRRRGLVVPEWLFVPVAEILARHGVAAEINFHSGNRPSVAFTRECLARGVRLAFGSDAHELCEIGDFAPHLEHLKEAGYQGPPEDVLLA
jgi:histidinol phosphatase-like PHP family hydrolase